MEQRSLIVEKDVDYFLRRAKEEAHLALTADRSEVAAAHHGLAIGYSAKARMARSRDQDCADSRKP